MSMLSSSSSLLILLLRSVPTTTAERPPMAANGLLQNHLFFPRSTTEAGALRDSQKRRPSASGSAAPGTRVADRPERDPFFMANTSALAHVLFCCPTVVEKYMSTWFSKTPAHRDDLLRNVETLFQALIVMQPMLHLRISRVVDFMGHPLSRVCGITFLRDMTIADGEFNYECDDTFIKEAVKRFDKSVAPEVIDARMAVITLGIVTHKERGGFLTMQETIGTPTVVLSMFESNDLLKQHADGSAWLVALLNYLLAFCDALTAPAPASDSEAVPAEVDARMTTAEEIFQQCRRLVSELRHRCKVISATDVQLSDALCSYKPAASLAESEDRIYGIPLEVVCDSTKTYLWLEWIWSDVRRHQKIAAQDETHSASPAAGLRPIIANLWRAKAAILAEEYMRFFEQWDAEWLAPVMKEAAQSAAAEGGHV